MSLFLENPRRKDRNLVLGADDAKDMNAEWMKEAAMLATETNLGGEILRKVLERCYSLSKLHWIVAWILRWRLDKFTMGELLNEEEILAARKVSLRLVQDTLKKSIKNLVWWDTRVSHTSKMRITSGEWAFSVKICCYVSKMWNQLC